MEETKTSRINRPFAMDKETLISHLKTVGHRFVDGDNVRYNVCELNHNRVQSDDWFCADGERKDGADNG